MTTTRQLHARLAIRATGDEAEVTITTPATDYMGDVVEPGGMDTRQYMAGPRAVFLAHDTHRLPVAQTLALAPSARGIRARFRWLEGNPEAAVVRAVFEQGALGASVGFIAVQSEPAARGYRFTKSVLTEWSFTGHPANPECVRMLKSLGLGRGDEIDLDAIPADDEVDLAALSRADVAGALHEAIREQTSTAVAAAMERRRWALTPDDAQVIQLDDDDVLATLTRDDVLGALRAALPAMVRESLPAALARARGRID